MTNRKSNIISNVIWKFAERICAQVVSLVVSIVLARILLPDEYGSIAMVTVFITIANVFVTSGLPNALIQKKDADDTDFSSVFYFNLAFSVVLYIILFFTAPLIASFYETPILSPVIRVMGIRIVIASINSVQHSYVSRHMMFRKYFWSTLFGTVLSGVIGIFLAYRGFGVWALVAQYMINTTVDTIVLWFTVKWRPKLLYSWNRLKGMVKYGWKILFEGLSQTLTTQIRSLIIGKVYTSSDLGYYTKSQQFPQLLVTNISTSISSVLFPAMSAEQDNKDKVKELLRKSVRVTSYVLFPLLTGMAVVGPAMISVILTDKWLDCVPYLQIFCFTQAATVGMIPRHQALNATGRSDVFMYEHIIYRVVALIILILVYKISVMAIALSTIAGSLIMIVTVMFTSKKFSNYKYTEQIKDVLPTLIGCVVMGVPTYLIQLLNLSSWLTLIIQVVVGTTIYILYSYFLKLKEFAFVIGYLKKILSKFKRRHHNESV